MRDHNAEETTRARRYGCCSVCHTPITLGADGRLLSHHPGVNAGTPRGGNALCAGTNETAR